MPRKRRPSTEAEAAALASGIRLRIIRLTSFEAMTNKELAARLGRDPATTLHHVRRLVDTGFLVPQEPRRGARGAKEIPYLSTGLSWQLDNADADAIAVNEAMLEAYLAEMAEADLAETETTRLVVQVGAEDVAEFKERLYGLLEEFKARPRDPASERTAVYVSIYPSR
ncbi:MULTISPECIES: ArsR/SmtB family transcription factor [Amycolatopsis]|uniref:Helix-turn-helix domain-containing protein n=1 Tax=Amycolatopsis dendrobii TaxID=2760662 RepID=A0A7W3ZAI5_9PSEU|nr:MULTISPECIES: winged helix-turn-helix domain-containing protein [Amycolatopsis]MBB1153733.1 helix-turn-helix domain-containing protein [Amycolatopsis dendrobii]UKD55531.1 winged helix-turn-helix domain-containing protein [Amycolatopsis sp. FU40]